MEIIDDSSKWRKTFRHQGFLYDFHRMREADWWTVTRGSSSGERVRGFLKRGKSFRESIEDFDQGEYIQYLGISRGKIVKTRKGVPVTIPVSYATYLMPNSVGGFEVKMQVIQVGASRAFYPFYDRLFGGVAVHVRQKGHTDWERLVVDQKVSRCLPILEVFL